MIIDIHICKNGLMNYVGYIESETFNADRCFHICNWGVSKKYKQKPMELHADINSTSKGICFTNPETGEIWMAKSIGWLVGKEEDIMNYVDENKGYKLWV